MLKKLCENIVEWQTGTLCEPFGARFDQYGSEVSCEVESKNGLVVEWDIGIEVEEEVYSNGFWIFIFYLRTEILLYETKLIKINKQDWLFTMMQATK